MDLDSARTGSPHASKSPFASAPLSLSTSHSFRPAPGPRRSPRPAREGFRSSRRGKSRRDIQCATCGAWPNPIHPPVQCKYSGPRRRRRPHPASSSHAGTRWVTERITARVGGTQPNQKVETTGRNRALNAACKTGKRPGQLLRKEELADGKPFSLLTAHAIDTFSGKHGGFVLRHSVGHLTCNSEVDVPLNDADYYYLEAMLRYRARVAAR